MSENNFESILKLALETAETTYVNSASGRGTVYGMVLLSIAIDNLAKAVSSLKEK